VQSVNNDALHCCGTAHLLKKTWPCGEDMSGRNAPESDGLEGAPRLGEGGGERGGGHVPLSVELIDARNSTSVKNLKCGEQTGDWVWKGRGGGIQWARRIDSFAKQQ
jgi:hypothetical protein